MQQGEYVPLPVFNTMLSVIIITLVPVAIGMIIHAKAPKQAGPVFRCHYRLDESRV